MMSNDQQPKQPVCPSCGSSGLKTTDAPDRAKCQSCLFHCFIDADGSTRDDRDTVVEADKLSVDDLNEHPAFLQVFSRRLMELAGVKMSDEMFETFNNHFIESKLPKPSGSTLA